MADLLNDLLKAWKIHNDINLFIFILDWVPDEGLEAVTLLKTGKPPRGRNVARIFAHMHAVRCGRLKANDAALGDLPQFEGSESPSAERLYEALEKSGDAVAEVVKMAIQEGRSLKGWGNLPSCVGCLPHLP